MKTWAWVTAAVATAALTASWAGAAPATQPTAAGADGPTTRPAGRAGSRRLPKPWSDLTTLTPQQQDQIAKIHADVKAQEKQIETREKADVMALLTPAQRSELASAQAEDKVEQKERAATSARKRAGAATQPTAK